MTLNKAYLAFLPLMVTASCVLPAAGADRIAPLTDVADLPDVMPPPSSLGALDAEAEAQWQKAAGQFDAPSAAPALPFTLGEDDSNRTRALDCLAAAIYYEARSESEEGQRAVAQVVLNRVRHPAFPASVCGVVYQGSNRRTGCQFSFTCDGSMARRPRGAAWDRALMVAQSALSGEVYAPVGNATHYHTTAILPYWAPSLSRSAVIGAHIFYRWKGAQGRTAAFRQSYAGSEGGNGFVRASAWQPEGQPVERVQEAPGIERLSFSSGTVRIHRGGDTLKPVKTASVAAAPEASEAAESMTSESHGVRIHRGTPTG